MSTLTDRIVSEAGRRVNVTRPLTRSLDSTEEGLAMNATQPPCSADNCDRPCWSRGLCRKHYDHAKNSGALHRYPKRRLPRQPCALPECHAPRASYGLCSTHLGRVLRHGDPDVCLSGPGAENHNWRGDEAGYTAMHDRLRRARGHARDHGCVDCGGQAAEWSYSGNAINELYETMPSGARFAYSSDQSDYEPRCVRCHRVHDGNIPNR